MLTIRGVFDGKTFRALPDEPLPMVVGEVPATLVLPNEAVTPANRDGETPLARREKRYDAEGWPLDPEQRKVWDKWHVKPLSEKAKRMIANAPTSRDLLPPEHRVPLAELGKRLDALRAEIGPIGISINELKDEARAE